jgi:pimeloyl-ACP methyl ester carboxylesterase
LRAGAAAAAAAGLWLVPVGLGWMNPSTPFDYALNLGSFAREPALAAPADGRRRVVVLVHGLWRSAGSLWKLERALRAHGYEPWNVSYPSTRLRIEQHAERLHAALDAALAAGRPDELYFVGHSLGGLVIRACLGRPGAPRADACVFVGTPHHGAGLLDRRRDWALFAPLFGDQAALQLSPRDGIYATLAAPRCAFGNVIGARGEPAGWNDDIAGDDDGTVGVAEAHLAGETDAVLLRVGHTRLSFADATIEQVLSFLLDRRFRR